MSALKCQHLMLEDVGLLLQKEFRNLSVFIIGICSLLSMTAANKPVYSVSLLVIVINICATRVKLLQDPMRFYEVFCAIREFSCTDNLCFNAGLHWHIMLRYQRISTLRGLCFTAPKSNFNWYLFSCEFFIQHSGDFENKNV